MQKVTNELLSKVSDCIVESIQPEKIVLFGSYAWGNPHPDSDVDLFVVVSSSDLPSYKRARAVYRSLRDMDSAKALFDRDLNDTSVYHCQQAAEKSLKAYLVWQ